MLLVPWYAQLFTGPELAGAFMANLCSVLWRSDSNNVADVAGRGAGQTGPARPRGVLQEIQALVLGFFTSLMPGDAPTMLDMHQARLGTSVKGLSVSSDCQRTHLCPSVV